MSEKLTVFDPAEYLESSQAIADFLAAALETNDPTYVLHAQSIVTRAKRRSVDFQSESGASRGKVLDAS
ncbi:hypothetical protein [Bordetella bronchiseptica]|uniref:hypothetical protein n=1 Tax=Bordetella bronchiseptica TaxID=518 RepID=UPI003994AF76